MSHSIIHSQPGTSRSRNFEVRTQAAGKLPSKHVPPRAGREVLEEMIKTADNAERRISGIMI